MAHMIPDRVPTQLGGEQRVYKLLQKLPEECLCYHEPRVSGYHPDFIVIMPRYGVLVIEVKGWYPATILKADNHSITLKNRKNENETDVVNPIEQARRYMWMLAQRCQNHSEFEWLIHAEGDYKGRFTFPFSHCALLNNISADQLTNHPFSEPLMEILPAKRVITRDVLLELEQLDARQLEERLKEYVNPLWAFEPLNQRQMRALRAIIHPEIRISSLHEKCTDLRVLDLKQENHALDLGSGHRVILGVAGSGKTVLLVARARLLSQVNPRGKILVICFNVTLSAKLQKDLSDAPNVEVMHFHKWAGQHNVYRLSKDDKDDAALGLRLLDRLKKGEGTYDAILVDEAQDFPAEWFQCIVAAMKDPANGDLVVVGDGHQGLYQSRTWTWKSVGIQAIGTTITKKFGLHINYRNSKEILEAAVLFAKTKAASSYDGLGALKVDPTLAIRSTGLKPVLIRRLKSPEEECDRAVDLVEDLVRGNWFGTSIDPIASAQIGILYPMIREHERYLLKDLVDKLAKHEAIWISEDQETRKEIVGPGVKIETMHASKGLQYAAVIVLFGQDVPKPFDNIDLDVEKSLMYVALTRAETYLAICHSAHSTFIRKLETSSCVEVQP